MRSRVFLCAVLTALFVAAALHAQAAASCPGLDMLLSFSGANDTRLPAKAREAAQKSSQGDLQSALALYQEASKADPRNWLVLIQLGALQYRLGRFQDAIATYSQSNAVLETPFAYGSAGMAYEQIADYGTALRSYQRAVQLCPDFPELYVRLASVCYRLGLYDDAVRAAEAGLRKRPFSLVANPAPGSLEQLDRLNKASLNETLADVYVARGMYAEASKLLGERKMIGADFTLTREGAKITRVFKGFPADLAGLVAGDILVSLDGEALAGAKAADLAGRIQKPAFGTTVKATINRGGKLFETPVVIGVPADLPAVAGKSRGTAAAPSVTVQSVEVRPNRISAGSRYDVEVSFVAADPAAGSAAVTVEYSYRVLAGEKVLYTRPVLTLEEPNGAVRQRTEHLIAVRTPGKYTFQAILRYKGSSAEKSAEFQIE
jgi:hypothetical protein